MGPLLNKRHEIYKARGFAERPPSAEEAAKLIAREPNLLRRPIVVDGKRRIAGFDEAGLRALRR